MGLSWDLLYWQWQRRGPGMITRDYSLKQHNSAEYIGCYFDSNLSGVSVTQIGLKKINAKLYLRQDNYFHYVPKWFLCNAVTQPHVD